LTHRFSKQLWTNNWKFNKRQNSI